MSFREDLQVFKLTLSAFTLANVPDAVEWKNAVILVTDSTPAALCWSNGTNWIATDDGTTVA